MSAAPLLFEETTREQRLRVRRQSFSHQNGLVLLPVLGALRRGGLLAALASGEELSSRTLRERSGASPGYLNVALRALASQGWLQGWTAPQTPEEAVEGFGLRASAVGREALRLAHARPDLLDHVASVLPLSNGMADFLLHGEEPPEGAPLPGACAARMRDRWGLPQMGSAGTLRAAAQLAEFLDGTLVAPVMVALGRQGAFRRTGVGRHVRFEERVDAHLRLGAGARSRLIEHAYPVLEACGWMDDDGERYRLTSDGRAAAFISAAYGVTLSYLPLFLRSYELLFGGARFEELFPRRVDGSESHVRRPMNIWGSGGAHDLYFRKVDEFLLELFRSDDPPLAVCDTGCGDGSYLRHIHEVLRDALDWDFEERPVHFIGSDLNRQSQQRSKRTLAEAGVPNAHVLEQPIDINFPDELAAGVEALGLEVTDPDTGASRPLRAADALHTNSMLIHNRVFLEPDPLEELPESGTDGAFLGRAGEILPGRVLQRNLIEFMQRWEPYVRRYGWLFIELHTVPVDRVADDPSRTPTIAYDGTHGFSQQYTVEPHVLLAAADAAGLRPGEARFQACFPDESRPRVTVTYLRGA